MTLEEMSMNKYTWKIKDVLQVEVITNGSLIDALRGLEDTDSNALELLCSVGECENPKVDVVEDEKPRTQVNWRGV